MRYNGVYRHINMREDPDSKIKFKLERFKNIPSKIKPLLHRKA